MATLPHQREIAYAIDMIEDCMHQKQEVLIVVETDAIGRYFITQIATALKLSEEEHKGRRPNEYKLLQDAKIFREGVTFENGSRILIVYYNNPHTFQGRSPDKIILTGKLGDLFGMLLSQVKLEQIGAWY